ATRKDNYSFASINGRTVELFKTADGTLVDGEYFTHLFYFKDWVKQFQVIQHQVNNIECKIVGQKPVAEELRTIENAIHKVMGKTCQVRWSFVRQIQPTKSGKHLYTISHVSH